MRTARQESKRKHKQRRKEMALRRVRNDTRRAIEAGTPAMYWDDDRGLYRSPDIPGNFVLDQCGELKAVNLELAIPAVQAFRQLTENQAYYAMLRWTDQRQREPDIPF